MTHQDDYCRYDRGIDAWSVLFANKAGLSKDKVDSIFSKFGEIKKIIQTGDSFGYCIVKFSSKEAAIKCLTADTVARESIKMKTFFPEKENKLSKNKLENESTTTANRKTDNPKTKAPSSELDYSFPQKSDKRSSPKASDTSATKDINKNDLDVEIINSLCKIENQQNDIIRLPNKSINRQAIETKNDVKLMNDNISHSKYYIPPRMPNLKGKERKENDHSIAHEEAGKIELNKWKKNETKTSIVSNHLNLSAALQPEESIIERNKCSIEGEIMDLPEGLPELIESKSMISRRFAFPTCQGPCCRGYTGPPELHEIIVANIDEACDGAFILELFQDYEPIFISNMSVHEEKAFRYCHVYFKMYEHAKAVERTYNGMRIYGRDLIVLRPESVAAHLHFPAIFSLYDNCGFT